PRPNASSSSYPPSPISSGPTTETGTTAAPVSISWSFTKGERSIRVTPSLSPSAFWRASIDPGSFFLGQCFNSIGESLRLSEWTLLRSRLKGWGLKRPHGQSPHGLYAAPPWRRLGG